MSSLFGILALWRRQSGWLLLGAIASLATLACGVALMAASGSAVSAGLIAGSVLLRTLGVSRVVMRYIERLITHMATFRALADLRVWFFRGLARSTAGGLGFRRAGDMLSRLVGDVEALDGLYLRILVPLAGAVCLLPILIWLIGRRNPTLAAVIGCLFALSAFVFPLAAALITHGAGRRLSQAGSDLRVAALDALSGLREVRAFSAEGRMLAQVQAREGALFSAQHAVATRTALAGAGSFLCGQGALLAILVVAGSAPVAAVTALFLMTAAFEAMGGLPRAGALAGYAAAAAKRVLEAANEPAPVPDPLQSAPEPQDSSLRFEGVRFRWREDLPLVFDGLSLDIPAGSRVAILGPSGAGKSSLAALALKVAAPSAGRVLLGGVDVATLRAAEVRARIGWLSQATHLFDDTIRGNLRLADPDAGDSALWSALDAARIGDLVRALPDGLDSWVGEGGARFSGGQSRRIALARALLTNAPILILDEPCAGLDAQTEREFLATLNETAASRTVILIAHRLTGVERVDRIYRLSAGHTVAAAA